MKYSFIGCGNMGGAVARALSKVTTDFLVTDRSGRAQKLAAELGCSYGSNEDAARCDRVFLCVKPYLMEEVLKPLQPIFAEHKPVLISMAGGLTVSQIEEYAGGKYPVIRILPNTPVAVGHGLTQYCHNELVSEELMQDVLDDLRFGGRYDGMSEKDMSACGTLSGAGPAYAYMFMEALADGAVACGVPRVQALEYAALMVIGAGHMVLESGLHPGALKDGVCSPRGSTIQGVRVLEEQGMRGAVINCIIAANEAGKKLGQKQ